MPDSDDFYGFSAPDSPEFAVENPEFDAWDVEKDVVYESPQRKKRVRKDSQATSRKRKPSQKKNVAVTEGSNIPVRREATEVENNWPGETFNDEVGAQHFEADPWNFEETDGAADAVQLSHPQENYLDFLDAVSADEDMIIRISREVFVVLGWTTEASSMYYHLSRICVGDETKVACLCPTARKKNQCFHERFMLEYGGRIWAMDEDSMDSGDDKVIMFLTGEGMAADTLECTFLVPLPGREKTIRNRAIVSYVGLENGDGVWKCFKDVGAASCGHVPRARRVLRRWKNTALDEDEDEEEERSDREVDGPQYLKKGKPVTGRIGTAAAQTAVSHLPRSLPVWALLRSDAGAFKAQPLREMPARITLDEASSCNCSTERAKYNPRNDTEVQNCTVYTLSEAWINCKIEVQRCSLCKRKIGPDCRSMGLFNWNNNILFTKELLDEYTSQYTSSETPFIAFVTSVARRYTAAHSPVNFITATTFRGVWFAYAGLHQETLT